MEPGRLVGSSMEPRTGQSWRVPHIGQFWPGPGRFAGT